MSNLLIYSQESKVQYLEKRPPEMRTVAVAQPEVVKPVLVDNTEHLDKLRGVIRDQTVMLSDLREQLAKESIAIYC